SLRFLQLADARGQLVEEAAVLDGESGGSGQRGEAVQVLLHEAPVLITEVGDGEGADDLAADEQRIGDGRTDLLHALRVQGPANTSRPGGVVVDEPAFARDAGEPQSTLAQLHHLAELARHELMAGPDDEVILAFRLEADESPVGVKELRRLARDQVQALRETQGNEDLLDDLPDELDVTKPLQGLRVQARVVEG